MGYVEILGVLFALGFLYFEYKESIWLWPLGIISSAFYIFIFFDAKFYADMSLQFYYFIISFYGWYLWSKGAHKLNEVKKNYLRKDLAVKLLLITIVLFVALSFILKKFTDSPVAIGDAFTSALAITGTWMLTRKILEQWLVWIVVNFISCGLYYYRGLDLTAALYVVYALVSIAGYYRWKNKMRAINE